MKPNLNLKKLSSSLFLLGFAIACSQAQAATPRITLRGLTGSNSYADVDALVPLNATGNSLFYIDGQGRYDKDYESFGGLGLGYRSLQGCAIWGGDLFADYTTSNSHHYWVLSPGLETIRSCWDARVNGYIPLKERNNECSYFLSGPNECGIYGDTSFVEFSGHQEFEHRFLQFEEVGPGIDAAIGFNLPRFNCARLQGSLYYYRFDEAKDITGVGARLDVPINSNWAITSEASYDNVEHGAFTVGLSFQLGHTTKPGCCPTLCDRLYDQVYRHNGPVALGTGVPVQRSRKDEGLFLRRDNIYFFSENGSAVLGDPNAGSYENPFRDDQFSDATVGAVGTNANFYFTSGDYNIDFFGDTRVTLADGLSLYGRSENFKSSVNGLDRPLLNGGLDIVGTAGHHLDSIRLENIQTRIPLANTTPVIGLSLIDGQADLCNTAIDVKAIAPGINSAANVALGITANNSEVIINRSSVTAIAHVGNFNNNTNAASAIGSYNADFSNNIFVINNSEITGIADVLGSSVLSNSAVGIGANLIRSDSVNLNDNQFVINCSTINAASKATSIENSMMALGIGLNDLESVPASFLNNQFVVKNSKIDASADTDNNIGDLFVLGIGSNISGTDLEVEVDSNFNNNIFMIDHSEILSTSQVNINNSYLFDGGIGMNCTAIGNNNFDQNSFEINSSTMITDVATNYNNLFTLAFSIGSNAVDPANNSRFLENSFSINKSLLSINHQDKVTLALVYLTNIGVNNDQAVTTFEANNFNINESILTVESQQELVNSIVNLSTNIGTNLGIFGTESSFQNNSFNITNHSILNATITMAGNVIIGRTSNIGDQLESNQAISNFNNNSFSIDSSALTATAVAARTNSITRSNTVYGITASGVSNNISLRYTSLRVLAQLQDANIGTNTAIGLSALGTDSIIRTFDSFIEVTALAPSETNTAIGKEGNVVDVSTTYVVTETP